MNECSYGFSFKKRRHESRKKELDKLLVITVHALRKKVNEEL
ncbi:hypothetical protein ASN86_00435 [Streptococcus parauberis]|uniref:Uncharacterized protein n=1 Tax=Streptococcus parauberis NCFD 2020 TaxID=873447 RepID=F1Z2H4_9STRE|nr:hypothetical protein SPB_1041 [Streptococcus parauberis NCFD 2020]PNY20225.1 hypothetical protein ASN86_00435 [Streptococcus parauberis]